MSSDSRRRAVQTPQNVALNTFSQEVDLSDAYRIGHFCQGARWAIQVACLMPFEKKHIDDATDLLERLALESGKVAPRACRDSVAAQFRQAASDLQRALQSEPFADTHREMAERVGQELLRADCDRQDIREQACRGLIDYALRDIPELRSLVAESVYPAVWEAIQLGEVVATGGWPEPAYPHLFDPGIAQQAPDEAPSAKYLANRVPEPGTMPLPPGWLDRVKAAWETLCKARDGTVLVSLRLNDAWAELATSEAVAEVDRAVEEGLRHLQPANGRGFWAADAMTQPQLAEAVDCSESTIRNWAKRVSAHRSDRIHGEPYTLEETCRILKYGSIHGQSKKNRENAAKELESIRGTARAAQGDSLSARARYDRCEQSIRRPG